jgi:hypothetical protein
MGTVASLCAKLPRPRRTQSAVANYVDLYFILSEQHATLTDIIDVAEKKFGFEFNSRLFLEQLVFLDDVEDTDIRSEHPG